MRRIERTKAFKRDFKKIISTHKYRCIETSFLSILNLLRTNKPLPRKNVDHQLTGNWKDYRDCHIKPDLILIYAKPNDDILQLVRLGSHSELGL